MTIKSKLIAIGLTAAVLALANTGYGWYKRLKYRVNSVTIDGGTGNTVNLTINWQLFNPTPVSLTVNSIKGDIYLNNNFVGIINQSVNQNITSNDSISDISIPVTVDSMRLGASAFASLISGGDYSNWILRIVATIKVEGFDVPLKLNYRLSDLL